MSGARLIGTVVAACVGIFFASVAGLPTDREACAAWTHAVGSGYDVWSWDGAMKFRYDQTNKQWGDYSSVDSKWYTLSVTGLSGTFIGDGVYHDLGNGFSFAYAASADYGRFRKGGTTDRFLYYYSYGKWYDTGAYGSWQILGNAGLSASFMGDGSTHVLGNNFSYSYASDEGTFTLTSGGANRFKYAYGSGQWSDWGKDAAWADLGTADKSAEFMGDGAHHDLGKWFGDRDWWFLYNADTGYFSLGLDYRFRFSYNDGRLYHFSPRASWWSEIGDGGGYSATFIGDGTPHYISGWGHYWWFQYDTASDSSRFSLAAGTSYRFAYDYASGQWYGYGPVGAKSPLGNSDAKADFLGDGGSHDLGTWFDIHWWFAYDPGNDRGAFSGATVGTLFQYSYGDGHWFQRSFTGGFSQLGSGVYSADFIGDRRQHDLGTWFGHDWWFGYDIGDVRGVFYRDRGDDDHYNRYGYGYATGQWYDSDGTGWGRPLGSAGQSASFMGDGTLHDLGSWYGRDWWYTYDLTNDLGKFELDNTSTNWRFAYGYSSGAWQHYDGSWKQVGNSVHARYFMGDGVAHDLGTSRGRDWWYTYDATNDRGQYGLDAAPAHYRLAYGYAHGQWWDFGNGSWSVLGNSGATADFLGDGNPHDLGTWLGSHWWFTYTILADRAQFDGPSGGLFLYTYNNGYWWHSTYHLGFMRLGEGVYCADFIGDGTPHDLGTWFGHDWWYAFDRAAVRGAFARDRGDDDHYYRFEYGYTNGQWYDSDGTGWMRVLGIAGNQAYFLGDGSPHDLSPPELGTWYGRDWWYTYDVTNDLGRFGLNGTAATYRFAYSYPDGSWKQYDGAWKAVGGSLYARYFIGDGMPHDLGTWFGDHWWFAYDVPNDRGLFAVTSTLNFRYAYDYVNLLWLHYGFTGGWAALSVNATTADFIGDGSYHNLGGGWWYRAVSSSSPDPGGRWSYNGSGSGDAYRYQYETGQWYLEGPVGGWFTLGPGGQYAALAYSGSLDAGNGWTYYYAGTQHGQWQYTYYTHITTFDYDFVHGAWLVYSDWGGGPVGHQGMSAWFIGDGNLHPLNNGYSYRLLGSAGIFYGDWYDSDGIWWYRYGYADGYWARWDPVEQLFVNIAGPVGPGYMNPGEP
jgi:hypothetical protein